VPEQTVRLPDAEQEQIDVAIIVVASRHAAPGKTSAGVVRLELVREAISSGRPVMAAD
jgi:hypothetical protein